MSDLTEKQLMLLRKVKAADKRGEDYRVEASDSRRTMKSLSDRGMVEIVAKTVFTITNKGERVLKEQDSKASEKALGDFQ